MRRNAFSSWWGGSGAEGWQDREWQGVLQRTWDDPKKLVIPVLVNEARTPAFLSNWVPVRKRRGERQAVWMEKIHEAIRGTNANGKARVAKKNPKPDKVFRARLERMERVFRAMQSLQEQ